MFAESSFFPTFTMKYSFTLSALLGVASSHTIFTQLTAGGKTYGIGEGVRVPSYDGPIQNVASNDIAVGCISEYVLCQILNHAPSAMEAQILRRPRML